MSEQTLTLQWLRSIPCALHLCFAKKIATDVKYWKPRGVTCTTDASIAGNIMDALDHPGPERLFPVGRLDKDSEGLILLTNDGRLPNAVNRAAFVHEKLYEVECNRPVAEAHLRQMARGVVITTTAQRDRGPAKVLTAPTRPCKVRRLAPREFAIVLTEGRNRQIRRMCEAVGGYSVVRLHRSSVMGISLRGLEGPGTWQDLTGADLETIQQAIASAEAHEPGADDLHTQPSLGWRTVEEKRPRGRGSRTGRGARGGRPSSRGSPRGSRAAGPRVPDLRSRGSKPARAIVGWERPDDER